MTKHFIWFLLLTIFGLASCIDQSLDEKIDDKTSEVHIWESSSMQSASIYYNCKKRDVTLNSIQNSLSEQMGIKSIIIPSMSQLNITKNNKSFMIQINDYGDVILEAQESAEDHKDELSDVARLKLSTSACRIEVGVDASALNEAEKNQLFDAEFDISKEPQKAILHGLTVHLDGLLWDNVNGGWWTAP